MERAKDASRQELLEVISGFDFGGELEEVGIFGNGHINETYCAVFSTDTGKKKFILQKRITRFSRIPWHYGKYQRSHLLAEEENPGERRGCGA